ncbi:MAG: NADP(H)-dependent aldo-keto reductase [Flavobacteriales bacterium]|nr:NADP(H)-dependent aldo-keto reductase [Flavobacteriales bacterium]
MNYRYLPNTDIKISSVCLGTMTFGEQNTEVEAHQQLDFAISEGVNFIDTAEMYPIAARKETLGFTEKYIGNWLAKRGKRDDLVIATKIAGPNRGMEYIRQPLDFSKKSITEAVELSLKNLQTDYIDLYQFHWPERVMNMFGKRGLQDVDHQWKDTVEEVLETCQELIKAGKIRHIGVSNESAWGVLRYLELHKLKNLPKISTIQNPYSLLNRLYEVGLTEIGIRENIGLLAYSPLGFGMLTGKHLKGLQANSRLGLFPQFTRYTSEQAIKATTNYQEIATEHGMSLTAMAIAFVHQQKMVSSVIVGATSVAQLKENIEASKITLSNEVLTAIEKVHEKFPNPSP